VLDHAGEVMLKRRRVGKLDPELRSIFEVIQKEGEGSGVDSPVLHAAGSFSPSTVSRGADDVGMDRLSLPSPIMHRTLRATNSWVSKHDRSRELTIGGRHGNPVIEFEDEHASALAHAQMYAHRDQVSELRDGMSLHVTQKGFAAGLAARESLQQIQPEEFGKIKGQLPKTSISTKPVRGVGLPAASSSPSLHTRPLRPKAPAPSILDGHPLQDEGTSSVTTSESYQSHLSQSNTEARGAAVSGRKGLSSYRSASQSTEDAASRDRRPVGSFRAVSE
jgi:hypothetical protein